MGLRPTDLLYIGNEWKESHYLMKSGEVYLVIIQNEYYNRYISEMFFFVKNYLKIN